MDENSKDRDLAPDREAAEGQHLTTNQGVPVSEDRNSLKAGTRGPTLLEDFLLREKITHFDHERIPERVVHARGAGAHGYFQVYESLAPLTKAKFLQDPSIKTPVFVRYSTVVGSRGSADTARDVRGFATKFYTDDGIWDLVGNNIPVFFIQDAAKFPDVVHAVKPEPHHEMPQAASAHDTFWDFVWLTPESTHMVLWVMSDRAIPRSFRMMEGFGVNTFRFINDKGEARFVKFHWKPLLGTHSLVWDEAQKLAGKEPDFHRRDLWESIQKGDFPEFEFGIQVIEETDEHRFSFDPLDPTKLWPEEVVPVRRVGKLTLNRNPDNFFAETEQVAFCPTHVVPGIDFSNDPLLQGRLFSYIDTQITRLGGPNFAEIPINRPTVQVHNNQRDGFMRQAINTGRASYHPNSLGGGCPMHAMRGAGFESYTERIDGQKVRQRSDSFKDHFSQAALFWNSQAAAEKEHIIQAFQFELSKVETAMIRERVVDLLTNVDLVLAASVAEGLGIPPPSSKEEANARLATGWDQFGVTDRPGPRRPVEIDQSPALSLMNTVKGNIKTRRIAILATDGVDVGQVSGMKDALVAAGAQAEVVSKRLGPIAGVGGQLLPVERTLLTVGSFLYDAVFIPGGRASVDALTREGDAIHFINEAFRHAKPIAAAGDGVELLAASNIPGFSTADPSGDGATRPDASSSAAGSVAGVLTSQDDVGSLASQFIEAIGQHRVFERQRKEQVPA